MLKVPVSVLVFDSLVGCQELVEEIRPALRQRLTFEGRQHFWHASHRVRRALPHMLSSTRPRGDAIKELQDPGELPPDSLRRCCLHLFFFYFFQAHLESGCKARRKGHVEMAREHLFVQKIDCFAQPFGGNGEISTHLRLRLPG